MSSTDAGAASLPGPEALAALPPGPLAIAASGGLDSTVLMHWLAAQPAARERGLRVLHVDHGLHADSARWARAVTDAAAALGLPCEPRRVAVVRSGQGLEADARAARHAAFADWLRPGELLALAHHRDDQAETVLLRLLRAAGGDGLAAMRPLRRLGAGWLWRPLLGVPREALVAYAARHGLGWSEDPSNQSLHHDRNRLRHAVLPTLRAHWPQAPAALARSAALLAEQADLLAGEDARRLARVQGLDPATLDVAHLLAEAPAWRRRLLRRWVSDLGLPPLPAAAFAPIEAELLAARDEARGEFAWAGARLRRWRGLLHAGWIRPGLPADWQARWTGEAPLALPTGDELRLEPALAFEAPLRASARRGGERLVLPGRRHHSTLKHVLQDLGVPPWERARLPLLHDESGRLLAAGDLVVSATLRAWLDARGARLRLGPR